MLLRPAVDLMLRNCRLPCVLEAQQMFQLHILPVSMRDITQKTYMVAGTQVHTDCCAPHWKKQNLYSTNQAGV